MVFQEILLKLQECTTKTAVSAYIIKRYNLIKISCFFTKQIAGVSKDALWKVLF
jgi:hypothetical protein